MSFLKQEVYCCDKLQQQRYNFKQIKSAMKLVIKHKDTIKIFPNTFQFDPLIDFISYNMNLQKDTIQIIYTDSDGDRIIIASDQDLHTLQEYFQGKEYCKIIAEGTDKIGEPVKIDAQSDIQADLSSPIEEVGNIEGKEEKGLIKASQAQSGECVGIQDRFESKKQIIELVKLQSKNLEPEKKEKSKKKEKKVAKPKKQKKESTKSNLNKIVTDIVDQRIKQLLPCLRQQILCEQKRSQIKPQSLIHQGYECKGCSIQPIQGIRYECVSCLNFNLCSKCEQVIDHEHNFIKIKKIIKKTEHQVMCQPKEQIKSDKLESWHYNQKSPGKQAKICIQLSYMFNGEPSHFLQFVKEHKDEKRQTVYRKYAKILKLNQKQYNQSYIKMRCQQLSNVYGKPIEDYQPVVRQCIKLKWTDLLKVVQERKILDQNKPKRNWWSQSGELKVEQPEAVQIQIDEAPVSNISNQNECVKNEGVSKLVIVQQEQKPQNKIVYVDKIQNVFKAMVDLFAEEDKNINQELKRFIEQNCQKTQEEIIEQWIQKTYSK